MKEKLKEVIAEALREFDAKYPDPQFLILGATGTGKSSLINRIFGKRLQAVNRVASTTRDFHRNTFDANGTTVVITDSPGYGEVGYNEQYARNVVIEASDAHAIVLVLKGDEKGYQRDIDILEQVFSDPACPADMPLLIAVNQVDKLYPVREWSPPYDVNSPSSDSDSQKLRNMREKLQLVRQQFEGILGPRPHFILPVMAEPEEGETFGVREVKEALFDVLPEAAKVKYARAAAVANDASDEFLNKLDREVNKVIKVAAAAAAGAVLVNPVPASDFMVLAPIQTGMIVKMGALYGRSLDPTSALEVLMALGAGVAARSIFQQVISFFPGVKNVIGPPYAAAATHGMGVAAKAYFTEGSVPSVEAMKEQIEAELKRQQDG
jgi:predicted GTPase